MSESRLLEKMVLATLVVAGLITIVIDGGWWIWLPVLLALVVVRPLGRALDR
jgi:hypothetical protein